MISYEYIRAFFTSVLKSSAAIQGRFHISTRGGLEINYDQLGDMIKDEVTHEVGRKYPLAFMMPPHAAGGYTDKNGEWEKYRIVMFFLNSAYYDGTGQPKNINPVTRTSTHTIVQDWHDMHRCAKNFIRTLNTLQRERSLSNNVFRLSQDDKYITPLAPVGVDRAVGIRLDFRISLFDGCELEDYTPEGIAGIVLPTTDPHPQHQL